MNRPILLLLAAAALVAGCATPAQTYIAKHPELSPAQQKILKTGVIPDGRAVASMTKEEIRLAMGTDPAQFTRIDGVEAWVFAREKTNGATSSTDDFDHPSLQTTGGLLDGPAYRITVRTTVFFEGDRATRAEVTEEKNPIQ